MISAWAPAHRVEQRLRGEVELEVDVVAGRPQAVEAAVGDLLGDEDAGHAAESGRPAADARQTGAAAVLPRPARPSPHYRVRRSTSHGGSLAQAVTPPAVRAPRPRPARRSLRQRRRTSTDDTTTTAAGDDDHDHRRRRLVRRLAGVARRPLPGGQGRRRHGPRRLHRPPRHRHRQGRRPHVQPVRLRGHEGRRGLLRLRDQLHRDGVRGRLRQEHRHRPRRRPRRRDHGRASCSPPTRSRRPTPTPTPTSSASTSSSPTFPDNYVGVLFNEDEGGYLAGVLAASLSESGIIGVVGGREDVPPVVKLVNGYEAGAKSVNPDIRRAQDLQRVVHRPRPRAPPMPSSSSVRAPT